VKDVALTHNLQSHIYLQHECLSAEWLDNEHLWRARFVNQSTNELQWRKCRVLITAVGFLDIPKGPEEIADIQTFSGTIFHSSKWDHTVDFMHKDVLVVGNGCSANQFVPWLIGNTHLRSLVQVIKSAQWIAPKGNNEVGNARKW